MVSKHVVGEKTIGQHDVLLVPSSENISVAPSIEYIPVLLLRGVRTKLDLRSIFRPTRHANECLSNSGSRSLLRRRGTTSGHGYLSQDPIGILLLGIFSTP